MTMHPVVRGAIIGLALSVSALGFAGAVGWLTPDDQIGTLIWSLENER